MRMERHPRGFLTSLSSYDQSWHTPVRTRQFYPVAKPFDPRAGVSDSVR